MAFTKSKALDISKASIIKWAQARKKNIGKPTSTDDLRDSSADMDEIMAESNKAGEHDALDALIEFLQ